MKVRAAELEKTVSVTDLAIYETLTKQNELIPATQMFEKDLIDGVFFTSASTVRAFVQTNPETDPAGIRALCIGEMTAEAARAAGMIVHVAQKAAIDGLIELAEKLYTNE